MWHGDDDLNDADITVPETALVPVETDWCLVQIPAKDFIPGMSINCGDGTTVLIVSISVLPEGS